MKQKTDSQTGDGGFCEMKAVSTERPVYRTRRLGSCLQTLGESERCPSCG